MHILHTTEAFILRAYPNGESNRVYKLYTKEFGLLYAHGQGVRELKSRNKFALQTGQKSLVTLVRGREVWRITGAQKVYGREQQKISSLASRRLLRLIEKMVPIEDKNRNLFSVLSTGVDTLHTAEDEVVALVEGITVLRVLDVLGYVARPITEARIIPFLESYEITPELIKEAKEQKSTLFARVNSALQEAK
jgi:recombinational DNA repair protein (RecF pathway)